MKKIIPLMIILTVFILVSCNKDNGEQMNTIEITDGEFSSYCHTISPNLGFWSPVDEMKRYIDFEGNLTGQFIDISHSSRKISFSMILSLPMQEI
jgi:hypothetical protein